jgi:hypothetical protein
MWKEREPEYKRLIGSKEVKGGVGQLEVAMEQSEAALAAEPTPATPLDIFAPIEDERAPEPTPTGAGDGATSKSQAKRERRRQRRRTRPHGRAR